MPKTAFVVTGIENELYVIVIVNVLCINEKKLNKELLDAFTKLCELFKHQMNLKS